MLLDPEAEPPPGSLTTPVTEADRWPGVGLAAPMLCHPETGEAQAALKSFLTWPRLFERRTPATPLVRLSRRRWAPSLDGPTPDGWLSGACLPVCRELGQAVGRFFMLAFLDGESSGPRRWCRRLFKGLRIAGLATGAVTSRPKTLLYTLRGDRRAAKHRDRFRRALVVLRRLPRITEL